MRDSETTKDPGTDLDDPDQSEESIILSTMDESMPASLAVDENGLFDIDKINAQKLDAIKKATKDREIQYLREESGVHTDTEDAGSKRNKPKVNPVHELLRILRIPERWLIDSYYKSAIRKNLYDKFDWYRDFEGNEEVSNKLENVYRGSTKALDNTTHFIRNNVLATLLLTAFCGQMFVSYLSQPSLNRYTDRGPTGTANAAVVDTGPDEAESLTSLNHCVVGPDLRQVYGDQQDNTLKRSVLAEVSGFIQVYDESDLENWYATRDAKRDVAIGHIQTALPRIQGYSIQISEEIAETLEKHDSITNQLDNIDVTTKQGINQYIRVRTELMQLDDQIRYSPAITRTLNALDNQALRLKKIFSGSGEEVSAGMSRWAVTSSNQDLDALTEIIGDVIKRDVDGNIVDLALDNPETKLYRLQILAATLRDFGDLIIQLSETSNHNIIKVADSQNTSNGRLRDLLGFESRPEVSFLDYDNCLSLASAPRSKLTTIRQVDRPRAVPSS